MNTKIWLAAAVIALGMSTQGCTLKTQYLRIDPDVKVKEAQIGGDKTIGLRIADVRADKKLGEVGDPDRKMVDVMVEVPSLIHIDRVVVSQEGKRRWHTRHKNQDSRIAIGKSSDDF